MADANPINTPAGREGPLTPVVFAKGGEVLASSRDVAAYFEKRHDNVLQAIDNLLQQASNSVQGHLLKFQEMFVEEEIGNGAFRRFRTFNMTRDAFMLLVMGFTGEKALDWKLAYIAEFNRMEEALKNPPPPISDLGDVSLEEKRLALGMVRQAQAMFGVRAARRLWAELGLLAVAPEAEEATAFSEDADPKDWRGALRHLLSAPGQRADENLWGVIERALGEPGGKGDHAAQGWLGARGLYVERRGMGGLFISNGSVWLHEHFGGTVWSGRWNVAFRAVSSVHRPRQYLGRRQQRGAILPLEMVEAVAAEV